MACYFSASTKLDYKKFNTHFYSWNKAEARENIEILFTYISFNIKNFIFYFYFQPF